MINLPKLTPWEEIDDPIHLFSRFSLKRNLARHPFPHKLSTENKNHLFSLIPKAISFQDISPQEREQLGSIFHIHGGFQHLQEGQGFLYSYPSLTLINREDHLSLYTLTPASKWAEGKKCLLEKEKELGTLFPFAYHPKFGFLTSSFDQCGSAFTYTIDLHLPLLHRLGHLQAALDEELEEGVILSSPQGDFISISNQSTLGLTEEHILHTVNASAQHLKRAELALREHIGEHKEIKDLILRAFGLLKHSCQLELAETIDALSLLMLGVELHLFTGLTFKELFALTFLSKREFLNLETGDDLSEKRAHFCQERLALIKSSNPECLEKFDT